jgi:hypothetical protein
MSVTESFGQDFRTALRVLAKNPGATALSILSIGLGIGLPTGTFSITDAMLLRPFPLERPGEVLYATSRGDHGRDLPYDADMLQAGKGLAAYQRRGTTLGVGEDTENLLTQAVTPNYFSLLGVKAALGRASVDESEGRPGVVLGYRLWQRRFGGDPRMVGQTVLLSRKAFLVTGVMPAEAARRAGWGIPIGLALLAASARFFQSLSRQHGSPPIAPPASTR